jgi:hypothetical protein
VPQKDFSYLVFEVTGINAVDNFIANRFNSKSNSPVQIAVETAQLGVALSKGEGVVETPNPLDGSFSITELGWKDYPTAGNVPRPKGSFKVLEQGPGYEAARLAANKANKAAHQKNKALKVLDIHEIGGMSCNESLRIQIKNIKNG